MVQHLTLSLGRRCGYGAVRRSEDSEQYRLAYVCLIVDGQNVLHRGVAQMDEDWMLNIAVDVGVGIFSTFCAVLLVYAIARPRFAFDPNMRVTRRATGDRYGVRIRNSGVIPILTLRAEAFLILRGGRGTSVPIPLSRDTWTNIRRAQSWRPAPRLLMEEINWKRHLPHRSAPRGSRLEDVMIELDAKLFVRVTAVSSIFSVAVVRHHAYGPGDRELTADSGPEVAQAPTSTFTTIVSVARRALAPLHRANRT